MANNRMWIVCKKCAAENVEPFELLIAKFWGVGYVPWTLPSQGYDGLRAFLDDHAGCSISDENCFELRYEVTPKPAPNTSPDVPLATVPNP